MPVQRNTLKNATEASAGEEKIELSPEKEYFPDERYPLAFYNPIIPDERFHIEGDGYLRRFVDGKFIANNAIEEEAARSALAIHGAGRADRWMGDDRKTEWSCKKCNFRTFNSEAQEDHEVIQQH